MKRPAVTTVVAFSVGGGIVLGDFVGVARPTVFLVRPLSAVAVLAVAVGLVSSAFGRNAVAASVFLMVWLMRPGSGVALAVAVLAVGLIVYRLHTGQVLDVGQPAAVASGVFLAVGLIPVIPLLSVSTPAHAITGGQQYVVLLDGYPRADTLAEHGIDITWFLAELETRGFDLYPDATTEYPSTFETLTVMTGGDPSSWQPADVAETRRLKAGWRLPVGWMTVAPPMGFVTLDAPRLNPLGITFFEDRLIAKSSVGRWAGDWVMDAYREQLGDALEAIPKGDRVFAHLFAPHPPALYTADGTPLPMVDCWPHCPPTDTRQTDTTLRERVVMLDGYIAWLNRQLIEVIDRLPGDADVVLFSDHGGRFDEADVDEWHRVFLASRTPGRPGLFADSPHPETVFQALRSAS